MSKKAIVLLSGGLDSSANLALALEDYKIELALTVDYAQRAAKREIQAAKSLAEYYDVTHTVVDLKWLGQLGGSALTDEKLNMPLLGRTQLDLSPVTQSSAQAVWVPNRNGILINVAAAYAERLSSPAVIVGFNKEEAATFPDNSGEFLAKATEALKLSTSNRTEVICYTTELDKRQIVSKLKRLSKPFPFERVWSCYFGNETPCNQCESCQRFARALGL